MPKKPVKKKTGKVVVAQTADGEVAYEEKPRTTTAEVPKDLPPETAIVQKIELPVSLRLKLGSLIVHCEEATSANAHDFDLHAISGLLQDPEVVAFKEETAKMGILPVKR